MGIRITVIDAHNPSPMTGHGNHTYLLTESGGEALLVDAGVGDSRHLAEIDRALHRAGGRLTRVVVTHGHADHASGAPAIASANAQTAFAKFPWAAEDRRYDVAWQPLADGDRVAIGGDHLEVLHTPGHSPDHVAFWHAPTRTAFTGDLVIQGGSVMIHWSRGGSVGQYLASLERLLALDARVLLPAHGPEVTEPARLIRWYLDHRRLRERQVRAALEAGLATVPAIAESIYHGLEPALMAAARENVRAHLEQLKADGHASDDDEGRWRIRG